MAKKIDFKIKFVEIVLENCEVFTFDGKDVAVKLGGLGREIWSDTLEFETAKYVKIWVNKKAKASGGWDNEKWQDRIKKDITQIHLTYTGGMRAGYHVDWDLDGSDYENSYEEDTENEVEKVYTICNPKWREFYE